MMDDLTIKIGNDLKHKIWAGAEKASTFDLPMVSVIVVNYNYGRFLRQAVDSIFAQNYPNIECIIVDNASTDESAEVLLEIAADYPSAVVLRRARNEGQCAACVDGFAASSGEYIVFLDADDVLVSAFVETHVFVHLSLRLPVGLTSSDMMQALNSRIVLSTIRGDNAQALEKTKNTADLLRNFDSICPEFWPLQKMDASIKAQVRLIEPMNVASWVWSPTSGNCFRRDALDLFIGDPALPGLRYAIDTYLIRGISVLTGSVLIDRPLSIYRMHGGNGFTKHPHLHGVLNYDRFGPNDLDLRSREMIIDHCVANARMFNSRLHEASCFIRALEAINDIWPPLRSRNNAAKSYLAERLETEADALADVFGRKLVAYWRARQRHSIIRALKAWGARLLPRK